MQHAGSRGRRLLQLWLSFSAAWGIFPDQGSILCPLHWQTDSYPQHHVGDTKAERASQPTRVTIKPCPMREHLKPSPLEKFVASRSFPQGKPSASLTFPGPIRQGCSYLLPECLCVHVVCGYFTVMISEGFQQKAVLL